jgi:hypothetical protein
MIFVKMFVCVGAIFVVALFIFVCVGAILVVALFLFVCVGATLVVALFCTHILNKNIHLYL